MGRPTNEERTCPECGSLNTSPVYIRASDRKFLRLTKRFCGSCQEIFNVWK